MMLTRRCLDVTVMPTFLNKYHDWVWTSTVSGWQLVRSELLSMLCCCYYECRVSASIRIQAQQNNQSEILLTTQSSSPLYLNIHTSTAITEYITPSFRLPYPNLTEKKCLHVLLLAHEYCTCTTQ
jgi:hypothetical protein